MQEYYPKVHAIFDKDVFRLLKEDKTIANSKLIHKPAGKMSLLEFNNVKYKKRSDLIMELYQNPLITEDQLYLIDKVARLRGKTGRFGVDHSEILNYELELANQERDQHMNQLVYRDEAKENSENKDANINNFPGEMKTS